MLCVWKWAKSQFLGVASEVLATVAVNSWKFVFYDLLKTKNSSSKKIVQINPDAVYFHPTLQISMYVLVEWRIVTEKRNDIDCAKF